MPSQPLRPQDLLVEYRDVNLARQGSIPIEDLRLKMQPVFNGVGSWLLQLPAEHPAVAPLRLPGAGILVTNLRTGVTLLSGPTSVPSKKSTASDPKGTATIAGLTDDRLLWDARAFPQPSNADATTQNIAYDVRTGVASTILRAYVNANIGPGSPAGRRGSSLRNKVTLGADPVLGATTTRRARFDILGDLLASIALETGLGFRLVQVGTSLQLQTYQPTDRTATIRLDVYNGTLQEQSVEKAPPEVTRMIVAGQGEGAERQFVTVTSTDSVAAEAEWGLIIEEFKDQRNTDVTAELQAAGTERLKEAGFTKVAVKAVPANDQTMIFLTDFFLGDKVSVVVDGQEQPNSIITEAAIIVDDSGFHTAVAIGDIADFDSTSALRQTITDTQQRVDNLERNSESSPAMSTFGFQVTDWNDALTPGFYYSISGANQPTPIDAGAGTWWAGIVTWHPGTGGAYRVMQEVREARTAPSGIVYRRYWNSSAWSAWVAQMPIVMFHGTVANITHTSGVFFSWGASGGAYTEVVDPFLMHDPTTNPSRIVIPTNGLYRVTSRMFWVANSTGARALTINQNGTAMQGLAPQWPATDNSAGQFNQMGIVSLAAGDYLEFTTRQTAGANLVLTSGAATVELIG